MSFDVTTDLGTAIQVGAALPEFILTDALGNTVSSKTVLANGYASNRNVASYLPNRACFQGLCCVLFFRR